MDPYSPITTAAKLSLPLNGTVYTTTRKVAAEKKLAAVGSTMAAELGASFALSRVIEANETPVSNGGKTLTLTHALIPTIEEQLPTNWEYSNANIGGQKFDSISRTFIYPVEDFSPTDPAPASAMPVETGSPFTGEGYILVSRSAQRAGMQLEPVFKVEVRQYVKRVTMVNVGVDQLNGKPLFESTMIYHASEKVPGTGVETPFDTRLTASELFATPTTPWWGIQDTGFENSGSMLSSQWYALTSSQVVAGTLSGGVVAVDTCSSNDDYLWPAVLEGIEFMQWALRVGGTWIAPLVHFSQESYRGPCATITTRTWSKSSFTIPVADQMLPNSIHYVSPFFRVEVPPCLHANVTLACDIGNTDPQWAVNDHSAKTFLATNHPVWPNSIIAYDDQQPYRGGYLRVRKEVFKPAPTGGGIA